MPIINQVVAGGGTTPTGTIQITNNGTHDVTNYATADVNVPTTAPALYREFQLDNTGKLIPNTTTTHIMDFTGVTDVLDYALAYAYYNNTNISGVVDMSDVVSITGAYACSNTFRGCTGITGVIFTNLERISGGNFIASNMFFGCTGITGVLDFPKLKTINATNAAPNMFSGCTGITGVNIKYLETVSGTTAMQSFFSGTGLITCAFESLNMVSGIGGVMKSCFSNCSALQSLWFYALNTASFGTRTDQFNNMISGVTGCTVHFPMAIQSTIGSWADVTAGFGGTNTTVLFDIVTTLTGADGNTYARQEKDSTTTATAWVYNDTLYYTSGVSDNANGVNEPSVSDAIYSDAACTQSVTTITAIA